MKPDYSLYLVTDRMLMRTKTLGEAVEQAVIGGCTMVQLREKEISSLDFYVLASEMKKITDIKNALISAKQNTKTPTVIEFIIDREINVMPIVPPGNSLNDMILESEEG